MHQASRIARSFYGENLGRGWEEIIRFAILQALSQLIKNEI